jgi:5-methylcytosine-specific restriction endonuclease McrA
MANNIPDEKRTWIFQANPRSFKIDDYLSLYPYVYWRAPIFRSKIHVGDPCFIWRAGPSAGAVARGHIAEAPQVMDDDNFPEASRKDLWIETTTPNPRHNIKVGIQIQEVRLYEEDGFVPRSVFKDHPVLKNSTIIKVPQGTVFRLQPDEAAAAAALWGIDFDIDGSSTHEAMEGTQRLRSHYARERNQHLIQKKKTEFAKQNDGRVFCEVCDFNFSAHYPSELGDGYIEAHHKIPLSSYDRSQPTALDDLLLVCSNCHRMIHRSKEVDKNLNALREHFAATPVSRAP